MQNNDPARITKELSPVFSANRAAMRLEVTPEEWPIPSAVLKTSGTNVTPWTSYLDFVGLEPSGT